jgi:hypothetical protein
LAKSTKCHSISGVPWGNIDVVSPLVSDWCHLENDLQIVGIPHLYRTTPKSPKKKAQLRHAYFALSLFQGELNDQTFSSLSFCTHWREAEGHQQLKAAELRPFFGHCDLFWAMVIET